MKRRQSVIRDLMVVERAAWWNPKLRRILKAAPLVVIFLVLNSRFARAACSFNPSPDPTADGAPNSLRSAIIAANASGQDCLIRLESGTYSLTIKNTHGQENAAAEGDLDITDSGHTVTIQGKGSGVSIINGNGSSGIDDRVFQVLGGANAVFRNMTIEGGIAHDNGTAGVLPGSTVSKGGGVLVQDGGQVTFSRVALEGNQALGGNGRAGTPTTGNGAPGKAAEGGGLFLFSGTISLTGSTLSGNSAVAGAGGDGFFARCTFTGPNNTFICNGHSGPGGAGGAASAGGLYVLSGSATLSTSTVSGNKASGGRGGVAGGFFGPTTDGCCASGGNGGTAQGAGMFLQNGDLSLGRTTVSGNSATGGGGSFGGNNSGGGGGNGGSSQGAGIYVINGNLDASNTTFFANAAQGGFGATARFAKFGIGGEAAGGGLYLAVGTTSGAGVGLAGVTLASCKAVPGLGGTVGISGTSHGGGIANVGAGLFISTTLIGNNRQGSGNPNNGNDVSGQITSSYSLIGQTAGASITDDGGNIFNVNPLLDPNGLASNGGPTHTVALESGSPAIDTVPVANCTDLESPPNPLIIDQRGFLRPDSGEVNCDIGAYEVQDTTFLPFSSFGGNLKIDPDAGVFLLSGGFKLGSGGSIDPITQPVAFSVGSYAIRLPVGSFVKTKAGYVYERQVNGIFLRLVIKFTSTPGTYQLLANRSGGTLTDTFGPQPVTLTIGDNSGTTVMSASFN